MRKTCLVGAAICCALVSGRANADTYVVPWDFDVVCLDLEKGTEVWRTTPRKLGTPKLYISGGALVAESEGSDSIRGRYVPLHVRYSIDLGSGRAREATTKELASKVKVDVGKLARLGNLIDSSGRRFAFDSGNTRHLEVKSVDGPTVVKKLDTFPGYVNLVDDTAIFTFSGSRASGGEVYAFSLADDRLEWEFDASHHLRGLSERAYTFAVADSAGVYVSVDQVLFGLDRKTGRVRWKTPLPRQTIRRYDDANKSRADQSQVRTENRPERPKLLDERHLASRHSQGQTDLVVSQTSAAIEIKSETPQAQDRGQPPNRT